MTLTELRYIVAVAHERHFGRAAQACFVSQPTLSIGVRKLEEELNIVLFERGPNEVLITPQGQKLVEQAQRVLAEAGVMKRLAREGQDQLVGSLRFGVIYTIGPYLLPNIVPWLRDAAPEMPLLIDEDFTANLLVRLKRGEIDIAALSLPIDEPGIETLPLYDEPFVVVLPSGHPWVEKSTIDPHDLAQETLLTLGVGHCFRDQLNDICPDCFKITNEGSHHQLEAGSLETIRHMVASGIGVTVFPCTAAGIDRYSQRLLTIRRFAGEEPLRRVVLAWRKSFSRPKVVGMIYSAVAAGAMSGVHMVEPPSDFLPGNTLKLNQLNRSESD